MITIEVNDEEFQEWIIETQEQVVSVMISTLQSIATIIEYNADPLVPEDTSRLRRSFFSVPVGLTTEGFIEVEIGYSAHDPRDYYDYAEYTHTGIDYRTGDYIQWHKPSAQNEYLVKGIILSERDAFRLIETDYISLFRKGR